MTYRNIHDPPREYNAKAAKLRLDTKKTDGSEKYTYIATFLIYAENKYIRFEVSQTEYDEIILNDDGILTCNLHRKRFINWAPI